MLYPKNLNQELSKELFANPTSEYRGAPFWSWNGSLDEKEVADQALIFKEMGFGGYFMHVRKGLATEYLGEKFLNCVKEGVEVARENKMLAWLYDEDRWPSGFAGGFVTKNKRHRLRFLVFSKRKLSENCRCDSDGKLLEGRKLLARYRVFAPLGTLISYKRLSGDGMCNAWYAYLVVDNETSYYNHQTYVDTLSKEAIESFADITYEAYRKKIGDAFGNVSPAMFTDEPQFYRARQRIFSILPSKGKVAWTDDFDETFSATNGYSILDRLPELFWEPKSGVNKVRLDFYDHLSDRFASAFADTLGRRCEELNLKLTGHLMEEPTLASQTHAVGDAMRSYRGFGIPGIDMLCARYEFTTAKQTQSAVNQYGKEAMLSELYGVSRWDYDFRNYKMHGDWQAALGVTVRVPHLSLMTMKGEAKRDYPASIFYQSSWYKKFPLVENHFGRLNTALTRGKPVMEIAVIHPIESFWLDYGAYDVSMGTQKKREKQFFDITNMLIRSGLDFNYIDEALLPTLCEKGGYPLNVGKMAYKAVVVPSLRTIRKTTLDRLIAFRKEGGDVIFVGDVPKYVDAKRDNSAVDFAEECKRIPFEKYSVVSTLERHRLFGVYDGDNLAENTACQLRDDNGTLWLFVAGINEKSVVDDNIIKKQSLTVKVKGKYFAEIWNTLDGSISAVATEFANGFTSVKVEKYNHDSFLFRFSKSEGKAIEKKVAYGEPIAINGGSYTLNEPNALLLDTARFSLDGKPYSKKYEILRGDNLLRAKLKMPLRGKSDCQPWAAEKIPAVHTLTLKFDIISEIEYKEPKLALEDIDTAKIKWNGSEVKVVKDGWYVDKAISTMTLPTLNVGKNVLEISLPFGHNTNTEWCYLLGNFGVRVNGTRLVVTTLPKTLEFADLSKQGLPFYGGKVTYHTSFEGSGEEVKIAVPSFDAPIVELSTCNVTKDVAFAPYDAVLPSKKGKTPLDVGVYLSRQNSFGIPHQRMIRDKRSLISPHNYRQTGLIVTRRYVICRSGILTSPTVQIKK